MSTVVAIAVTVIGFSLLVVVHEAGHAGVARLLGMRVDRFSIGFGPVVWSTRRGDTEYAISALPLGGYVKIAGMATGEEVDPGDRSAYCNQAAWRRFLAIAAGPVMNWIAAVVLAASLAATVGLPVADPSARVGDLRPGWPAQQAGLLPGDRIEAVGGVRVDTWNGLVAELQKHPGQRIALDVLRGEGADARRLSIPITPRDDGGVGRVGFSMHALLDRRGPAAAIGVAISRTNAGFAAQLHGFAQVFSRRPRAGELSGPVGIAQELFHGAQAGAVRFLTLLWNLSIALALLNLLPLPALDGGRLVFLAYEIVSRRRVNERVENLVHLAGFVALLALILAVTVFSDLARLLPR